MLVRRVVGTSLVAAAVFSATPVGAGGHYVVKPAELVEPRSGELAFWQEERRNDVKSQGTFGSLTFRRNAPRQYTLDLGSEGTRAEFPEASSRSTFYVEGKHLFRQMHRHGYGFGVLLGADYNITDREQEKVVLRLPLSVQLGKRGRMHLNVGAEHDQVIDETESLWGVAVERDIGRRWEFVLAAIDNSDEEYEGFGQAGLRLRLMDDLLMLSFTYGKEFHPDAEEVYYLGVTLDGLRF